MDEISSEKPWRDEQIVRLFYHGFRLSLDDVSYILDCTTRTLRKWMDKNGVETRDRGKTLEQIEMEDQSIETEPWHDKKLLTLFYHGFGLSSRDVAYIFDTQKGQILKWLKKHDLPTRDSHRDKHPHISEDTDGYMVCHHHDGQEYQRFYLHRLLATLKFDLNEMEDKVVHHITGHKRDNRLENLELLSQGEHMKQHAGSERDYERGLPE